MLTTTPAPTCPAQVCAILPPGARAILTQAAADAAHYKSGIEKERILDEALAKVQSKYPQYFRQEQ